MRASPANDLNRLRREYNARAQRLAGSDLYSPFNPAHLFMIQQRQRVTLQMLRRHGMYPLAGRYILEVGCGGGGVLLEYLGYGATPSLLYGIDLLPDRLETAHVHLPHLPLACADGQCLPFPSGQFDLVVQHTVFSSILDAAIRSRIAQEMSRVTKPDGLILSYDFWLNPVNPHTCGIGPSEIRRLFPACQFEFRRVTLAPPITRRLIRISWILCTMLEKLCIFNTHYLVAIVPQGAQEQSTPQRENRLPEDR